MADVSFFDPKQELEVKRRRKMAEMMLKSSEQPSGTEVVSGVAVKQSPLSGLAKSIQAGLSGYQEGKASELEGKLNEERRNRIAMAIKSGDLSALANGTPEEQEMALRRQWDVEDQKEKARQMAALMTQKADLGIGGGDAPAPVKLLEEIERRVQSGDIAGAKLLWQLSKADEKGIVSFNPEMPVPPSHSSEVPPVFDNLGSDGSIPQMPTPQQGAIPKNPLPLPYAQPLPGYADASARNSAAKEFAKEQAKVEGKAKGEAVINLPKVEESANYTQRLIDDMIKDPGLPGVVGAKNESMLFGALEQPIAGTPEAGFQARLDQIGGKQFLEAFNTLRGSGQITEVEGTKAQNAIARMQTSQSEADFIKAANEFKEIVSTAVARARAQAGQIAKQPDAAPKDYKSKYGLE